MDKNYSVPTVGSVEVAETYSARFSENFVESLEKLIESVNVKVKALKTLSPSLSSGTYKDCHESLVRELIEGLVSLFLDSNVQLDKIRLMPFYSNEKLFSSKDLAWTAVEVWLDNTSAFVRQNDILTEDPENEEESEKDDESTNV